MDERGFSTLWRALTLLALIGLPLGLMPQNRDPSDRAPAAGQEEQQDQDEEKAEEDGDETEEERKEKDEKEDPWKEPARLYREYFGERDATQGEKFLSQRLSTVASEHTYNLTFLIALVPDPVDSHLPANFDQALEGLQQAYVDSGYLLDRIWLPWSQADDVKAGLHRQIPGVLLFRNTQEQKEGAKEELATLLLVGESPKSGIHKESFHNAVRLARELGSKPSVRVLGPSFSGSIRSLRLALDDEKTSGATFRIATGTATAAGLEATLGTSATFCRCVIPDDLLRDTALEFLSTKMGWDQRKIAWLTEADTGYGKGFGGSTIAEFPSGLSDIRTAWEKGGGRSPSAEQAGVKTPRLALDLSLAGQEHPVDLIPKFSPLSVRENDLALSNLLRTISHERLRYIGIVATDVRDKLFLAEQIRRFSPDVVLFTFESDLLYGHPELSEAMDGMVVLSNFSLFTAGQPGLPAPGLPLGSRRQSNSEFQQGFSRAAKYLLKERGWMPAPTVWISAVGNGSIWPIASLPVSLPPKPAPGEGKGKEILLCSPVGSGISAGQTVRTYEEVAERRDVQLLLFLVVLYLLTSALDRVVLPPALVDASTKQFQSPAPDAGGRWTRWKRWRERMSLSRRGALALGISVIWLAGALVAVIGSVPLWPDMTFPVSEGFFLMLVVLYTLLVWRLAKLAWPHWLAVWPQGMRWSPILLWSLIALLVPTFVAAILLLTWMPGSKEAFYLRVRAFSGGLSPVVPLAWLAVGLYVWALLELKRLRLLIRHAPEWPLHETCEPVLNDLPKAVGDLGDFLKGTRLPGGWLRIGLVVALAPPAFLLWSTVQPIAEAKDYGRLFLLLCIWTLSLGAISFYRFVRTWLLLATVLQRLEHSSLISAFHEISKTITWNPMRSFWQMPVFNVILLSVQKIEQLIQERGFPLNAFQEQINRALDRAFEARRSGSFEDELAARRTIQEAFGAVCQILADKTRDPRIAEFFAVRILSYIRHVFFHMRNCLIAAMVCGVFTLLAVSAYAFEPKQFISMGLWLLLTAAVIVTIWVFVQMDRNAALSAISGTTAGKVDLFDRSFILNVLTYGIVPLISILATQSPHLGSLFTRWLNPLLRVAGVD